VSKQLEDAELAALARKGAEVRLFELYGEIAKIHARFPELRKMRARPLADEPAETPSPSTTSSRPPRRRPKWTAAMRKGARDRMKKYWAGQAALRRANHDDAA
jgi:hypothetical protein